MSRDLPVLAPTGDLPALVLEPDRRHEPAPVRAHPAWITRAAQAEVADVAADPDGGVWVATHGGILRWRADLERYTRYTAEHGLPGQAVGKIAVDADGTVWALCIDGRLRMLAGAAFEPGHAEPVAALTVDADGRAWFLSAAGLHAADGADAIPSPDAAWPIRALAVAAPDAAWVASGVGLHRWDGATWVREQARVDLLALAPSATGLWLGTTAGLQHVDADGRPTADPGWPAGPVRALAPAGPDAAWAALGASVGVADATGWHEVASAAARVTAVAAAPDDEVWIGTNRGLLRGGSERARPVHTGAAPDVIGLYAGWPPPPFSNLVHALEVEPADGGATVWVGTPAGLYAFEPASDSWRKVGAGLMPDVRALDVAAGRGWVAGWSGGLRPLTPALGAAAEIGRPVIALGRDPDDCCYAATLDAVFAERPHGWQRVAQLPPERAGAIIQAIALDGDGRLWVGTNAGLLGGSPLEPPAGPLAGADVRVLATVGGALWVGTGRGLLERDGAVVAGLEHDGITALCHDPAQARAWVGTDAGLVRLEQAGGAWRVTARLTAADGLAADRVSALALGETNGDGPRLWVGTTSGLCAYDTG
jgi:ligand-binding sensor domain-containing protein